MTAAGPCLFCGKPGRSNEHLWPEWSHELITSKSSGVFIKKETLARTGQIEVGRPIRRQQQKRLQLCSRAPCSTCNNGWMSQIEERAKPVLTNLISGKPTFLTVDDQAKAAEWMVLRTFVVGYLDPDYHVIGKYARAFYDNRAFPPNAHIQIAGTQSNKWACNFTSMVSSESEYSAEEWYVLVVFGIGNLVFTARFTDDRNARHSSHFGQMFASNDWISICPSRQGKSWPAGWVAEEVLSGFDDQIRGVFVRPQNAPNG